MSEVEKKIHDHEFDNAVPLNIEIWSDWPEVDAAIDAIFDEFVTHKWIQREHDRMKTCLKVILLHLYTCHLSDPTRYVRYSRSHRSWLRQYNCLELSADQVSKTVDRLKMLKHVDDTHGEWTPDDKNRRQSRMRATATLIERIKEFQVSPLMVSLHPEAETIILKDKNKKRIEHQSTDETRRMGAEMQTINDLLSKTFINLYMSDNDLQRLQERMRDGKEPSPDDHRYEGTDEDENVMDEAPRGAIDFTKKSLKRIFNNGSLRQGGRLYGGFWQAIPREHRKYIRINHMNTIEVDFSSMHISLIYWLKGLPVPEDDLYTLGGFPEGTRDVVKKCLLTMINAKNRKKAMRSINERIRGYKIRAVTVNGKKVKVKKVFHEKDRIILPPGAKKIEGIIAAFEHKHEAIKDWFFTGRGVELQYWDSQIAVEILLTLAKQGVPCLPLHDSFIVSEPQAAGLRGVMSEAFHKVTGRYPRVDAKDSLTDENIGRGEEAMEEHYRWKMEGGRFSPAFRKEWSIYVGSIDEWKKVTGKNNIFFYVKGKRFNKETYE